MNWWAKQSVGEVNLNPLDFREAELTKNGDTGGKTKRTTKDGTILLSGMITVIRIFKFSNIVTKCFCNHFNFAILFFLVGLFFRIIIILLLGFGCEEPLRNIPHKSVMIDEFIIVVSFNNCKQDNLRWIIYYFKVTIYTSFSSFSKNVIKILDK